MGVLPHAAPPKADQLPHPILSPALMGPSTVSGSSALLHWSGLVLEKYICNPGERPEGNALDRSVLVMVCSPTWRGEYKATNGVLKRETLGTLTILPKGLLPAMRSAQTADLLYCAFDEAFVKGVADEPEGRLAPPHDKRGNLRDRAISEILNLLFAERQSGGASGRLYVVFLAETPTIRI